MSMTSHAGTQVTSLLARLTALSSDHKTTQSLITRLAKFPAQPGSSPLNGSGDNDARVELSAEIHQSLREQEEALELLRQEVEDLPPASGAYGARRRSSSGFGAGARRESNQDNYGAGRGTGAGDQTRLEVGVKRLGEDLKLSHTQFRRAQLTAKRAAEAAKRKERELLFAGTVSQDSEGNEGPSRRRRPAGKEKLSQDELVVNASSDVTAALRRTHQLMTAELSRSQFAQDTLDQSTAALTSLTTQYSNLDTLLTSSRNLLSTLLHSQKSDTWYLESAFYILVSTIIWLVFRRFLYGPLWWFVWFPLKIFYGAGSRLTATIFGAGASQAIAATTSVSNTRPPLIVQPSAQRGERVKWSDLPNDGGAPRIMVGAGGKGGPAPGAYTQKPATMTEKVEKMVDESESRQGDDGQQEGASGQDAQEQAKGEGQGDAPQQNTGEDVPRNPKKRMWEEPIARGDQKDEL